MHRQLYFTLLFCIEVFHALKIFLKPTELDNHKLHVQSSVYIGTTCCYRAFLIPIWRL